MNATEPAGGAATAVATKINAAKLSDNLLPPGSREKLVNLIGLVASALSVTQETREELTRRLLQLTSERLQRFDEACKRLGHEDERLGVLALEEVAESVLDWVLVRVVLCLWDGRGEAKRRGRPSRTEGN